MPLLPIDLSLLFPSHSDFLLPWHWWGAGGWLGPGCSLAFPCISWVLGRILGGEDGSIRPFCLQPGDWASMK